MYSLRLLYIQSTALCTDGGLREALAAYVLVHTSTYKEKQFSAEVVHSNLVAPSVVLKPLLTS